MADAFGQGLWNLSESSAVHCPDKRESDTPISNGPSEDRERKQVYSGRAPCKGETHYVQIPSKPLLQPVISVHNVHTLIEPFTLNLAIQQPRLKEKGSDPEV